MGMTSVIIMEYSYEFIVTKWVHLKAIMLVHNIHTKLVDCNWNAEPTDKAIDILVAFHNISKTWLISDTSSNVMSLGQINVVIGKH